MVAAGQADRTALPQSRLAVVDRIFGLWVRQIEPLLQEINPQMKQTRKGRNWHFGMKLHIGADKSRLALAFLVELGAAMMVASTMVPERNRKSRAHARISIDSPRSTKTGGLDGGAQSFREIARTRADFDRFSEKSEN